VNINITDINSVAIASLRYEAVGARYDDLDKVGTLVVTFKSGGSYAYHAVSVATMREVLASASLGSAIARLVRPSHAFSKIGDATAPVAGAPVDDGATH
jgi:hypothetical protein